MKNPVLKKAIALALGGTLAVSIPVMAASGDEVVADGSYSKTVQVVNDGRDDNGDEWSNYEMDVALVVNEGKISSITATPGTGYIDDNDSYLAKAFTKRNGINTKLQGASATQSVVAEYDAKTGATLSAEAAKQAVLDIIAENPAANENETPIVPDDGQTDPTSEAVYVLMNVPYDAFYGAVGTSNLDADAISSATNKVGNTGKAGGGYHSGVTAALQEDGTYTAVGGENGAHMEGVTWPVKASDLETVKALGGTEVTDETTVTVATMGKGQTSSKEVSGPQALMEQASYSYYVLNEEPANYLTLSSAEGVVAFTKNESPVTLEKLDVDVSYGTNWGDVQFDFDTPEELADKQLNAMVLTAEDGTTAGMIHLYNAWSNNSIAWNVDSVPGLDGKTITNIRYYVNDGAGNYEVYDVPVEVKIVPVYTGEVTAAFDNQKTISVTGLPEDIQNARAKVYHTTGGRGAALTYLTPQELDPNDGDLDPVDEALVGNTIPLNHESNVAEDGLTYNVVVASDNYAPISTTATYTAAPAEDDDKKDDDKKSDDDSKKDDVKPDDSKQDDSKSDDDKQDDSKSDDASSEDPADSERIVKQAEDGDWYLYEGDEVVEDYTGIARNQYGWWRIVDGKVDFDATGIFKNEYGWWRVEDGKVNFDAQEIYRNDYGWWKTTDGKVTFDETGIFRNDYGWWRVVDSKVDFTANGIYKNQYGWWKTTNGKVTFKENGVFKNEYGWWKVKDSKVDFSFNGLAKNKYGTWYIKNGKVDFTKNGKVAYNGKTYTIVNGKVK